MLLQIITNGIIAGAVYTLVALGFGLVYYTTRFFHFAHGVIFTAGAYFTFLFRIWFDFPLSISIFFAIFLSTLLGCLMEICVYRPLRYKGASPLILLLASLGIYIVLQNVISMVFGDATKSIRAEAVKEGLNVFGARITPIQILIIFVSVVLVMAVALVLKKTRIGKAMQAVANDQELASMSGIDSDRVMLWTFAVGSVLAGIAGILVALDVDMTPTMGMNALLMGVVAVIIGGMGSIPGIALGALLLGMAQQFGAWEIGSQWQYAIAFAILLIFLLFRPQGFLGKKVKTATL